MLFLESRIGNARCDDGWRNYFQNYEILDWI